MNGNTARLVVVDSRKFYCTFCEHNFVWNSSVLNETSILCLTNILLASALIKRATKCRNFSHLYEDIVFVGKKNLNNQIRILLGTVALRKYNGCLAGRIQGQQDFKLPHITTTHQCLMKLELTYRSIVLDIKRTTMTTTTKFE